LTKCGLHYPMMLLVIFKITQHQTPWKQPRMVSDQPCPDDSICCHRSSETPLLLAL
ncbi:MAG: hypothetical protein ACJAUZ_003099, partial [Flavobacteriaceae bacterium]